MMGDRLASYLGLLCGFGTILCLVLIYWIDKSLFIHPAILYATYLPLIVCMALAIIAAKSKEEIDFRRGSRLAFICFIVASILYYVFDFVMKKYIDPELVRLMEVEYLEKLQKYIPQSNEVMSFVPKFWDYFFNFVWGLIPGFIISAILAYIFKNK